ncbi:MAG TPA: gamma-glutamylcyclotransferase family protein [Syntrophobacteraceae bacterium]|nr:gamma-glutamylcyclotransferase family protein [Syntrophobacteraceae bacterium]
MTLELRVFAYGTLKRGFPNHDPYCAGMLWARPAWLWGRIFKLSAEIPAMTVPHEDILAFGTADVLADIYSQERFETSLRSGATVGFVSSGRGPGWKKVRGELLVFDDPQTRLPLFDRLEEFDPGSPSTYIRALVFATMADGLRTSAWTYIAGFDPAGLEEYAGESWGQCRQIAPRKTCR